jgi:CBS domain-containing protein
MATVRDILSEKGHHIQSIAAGASVLQATQLMNEHKIGALVVMENDRVAGIFTERDVLRRVIAEMRSAAQVTVGEVMTREVICVDPDTDLDEVSAIMKDRRIRHLPVCNSSGRLIGLISIGDVNAHYASHQQQTIHFLNDYIYGRV